MLCRMIPTAFSTGFEISVSVANPRRSRTQPRIKSVSPTDFISKPGGRLCRALTASATLPTISEPPIKHVDDEREIDGGISESPQRSRRHAKPHAHSPVFVS